MKYNGRFNPCSSTTWPQRSKRTFLIPVNLRPFSPALASATNLLELLSSIWDLMVFFSCQPDGSASACVRGLGTASNLTSLGWDIKLIHKFNKLYWTTGFKMDQTSDSPIHQATSDSYERSASPLDNPIYLISTSMMEMFAYNSKAAFLWSCGKLGVQTITCC